MIWVIKVFVMTHMLHMQVINHTGRAHRMLEEADSIEEELSKERQESVSNIDFLESVQLSL